MNNKELLKIMGKMRDRMGIIVALLIISLTDVVGQVEAVGARSGSMGGVSAALEDIWAGLNNPAGLTGIKGFSAGTSLEQRYLMKELGNYAITVSIPAAKGTFGVSGLFSGYQSYQDQKVSLAYGMLFGKNVSAGASLVYIHQKAGNESEGLHQVSYNIGTIVNISEKVSMGFVTFNPFQLYYKSEEYATAPSVFTIGMAYRYTSFFTIHTEFEKNLDYPAQIKGGLEYSFKDVFTIRGGIRVFPASFSFGAAFRLKSILVEVASDYHQYLGFTPIIALQYGLH